MRTLPSPTYISTAIHRGPPGFNPKLRSAIRKNLSIQPKILICDPKESSGFNLKFFRVCPELKKDPVEVRNSPEDIAQDLPQSSTCGD
jgi:hypothetical protein